MARERCCGIRYEHGALTSQEPCGDCPDVASDPPVVRTGDVVRDGFPDGSHEFAPDEPMFSGANARLTWSASNARPLREVLDGEKARRYGKEER